MKKRLPAFLLLTALALPRPAPAAPAAVLYDGKDAASAGLSAAPWGAGGGLESTDVYLFGGHSLKITTLDPYQGARLTLAAPAPLNAGEAGRVFQITLRRGAATLHYDPRTLPGATTAQPNPNYPGGNYPGSSDPNASPGGMSDPSGNYPGGSYPGGGGRRGGGRRGGFGARGAGPNGSPAAAVPMIPPVANLRLVFTLADGRQADILRPIPETADPSLGEGWFSVNVPLSLLKLPPGGDASLKALTVGGDHYGVFYVGRIQVATDTAPLTASIDGPATAAAGVAVPLSARVDGGFSSLRYAWDFGTGGETGTGLSVSPRFPDAGQDYTVTLTVSDADGIKQPVTATKKITVAQEAPQMQPGGPGGFPGGPMGGPGGPGGGFSPPPGNGNGQGDPRNE